jgi:hypothetical protein
MSVCLSPSVLVNDSAPTVPFVMKFGIWIFRKPIAKIQVRLKSDKYDGHCTWTLVYIYDNISLNYLRIKLELEKIKTHIVYSVSPPPPKIVSFMRFCGKYCRAGQATDYSIIRRVRFASWIPKATTHTQNM